MKTVLMALVLCISMGNLCAQKSDKKSPDYYKKGELQLGIDPQFGVSMQPSSLRLNHLRIGASGGVFLVDKLMVGIRGEYTFQRSFFGSITPGPISSHQVTGSIFSRYYVTQGKFSPFVEVGGGRTQSWVSGDFNSKDGNFFGEARVGMAYRMSKKVSFEASYFRREFSNKSFITIPKGGFNFGVNFHF